MVSRIIFISIISLISIKTYCQPNQSKHSLALNYNDVYIGKNISFSYNLCPDSITGNTFVFGIKYHDNNPILDNQYYLFKDRFFAETFAEHFGLTLGYNKLFNIHKLKLNPFLFAITDLSYISLHGLARNPLGTMPDGSLIYTEMPFKTPPWLTIETRVGVGLNIPLFNNFSLTQSIGAGIGYFYEVEKDPKVVIYTENYWEIIGSWNIGILYSFKNKPNL